MGSYDICLKEMGEYKDIAGYIILGLKKDGSFVEKRSRNNEDNRRAFKACLEIYRLKQKSESIMV
jgi:hypothetical protein